MISKIILGLFSAIILFQAHQVYGDEELLPIITIDFVSGNIIDLDESPQMVRADIQIQNYDPQDGYHYMQVTRVNDEEIIRNTEILPRILDGPDDDLWGVQILHYVEPGQNDEDLIGDYILRVYSEYGTSESFSPFSIVKSSMPVTVTQNISEELITNSTTTNSTTTEELVTPEELITPEETDKIPSWVHEIFVMYADEDISEDELLTALEYLISQGTINVNSN